MKSIFTKLGLIQSFDVSLKGSITDFHTFLRNYVEEKDVSLFNNSFEAWSSNPLRLKGELSNHGFKIRYKKEFGLKSNSALAIGRYRQDDKSINIDIEVNAVQSLYFLLGLLFMFCIVGGLAFFVLSIISSDIPIEIGVLVLLEAFLLPAIVCFSTQE